MVNDPISDMITRIRNANVLRHPEVKMPSSKMKVAIATILRDEGFITDFSVSDAKVKKVLTIVLKYGPNREKVIAGIKKISKPGLRVTCDYDHLPRVLKGLGIAIISTSKGVMTDSNARKLKVGGEVLAYVW